MNIYSTIRPLNYISNIFGLFSFVSCNPSLQPSINLLQIFYKLMLSLIVILFNLRFINLQDSSFSNINSISISIMNLALLVSYILTVISCAFYQPKLTIILLKMSSLENFAQEKCFSYNRSRNNTFVYLAIGFTFLLISNYQLTYNYKFNHVIWLFIESSLYLVQINFIFLVLAIREHLNHINGRLDYSVVKWEEVVVWSQHRAGIVGVARLVNAAYSVQVLALVTSVLIIVTTATFIQLMLYLDQKKNFEVVDILTYLAWMFFHFCKLFSCVHACESTMSEADKTAIKVNAIIRRINESTVRNKLKQFSLQLLHNKIQFSAGGFFPLDYTLVHSVVAASTMYLIILLQFQLSSKPTNEYGRELNYTKCLNYLNQTNSSYTLN